MIYKDQFLGAEMVYTKSTNTYAGKLGETEKGQLGRLDDTLSRTRVRKIKIK